MKLFLKLFFTLITLLICYIIAIQGTTVIYSSPTVKPFSGDGFFDPYSKIDSAVWNDGFMKSNFHAHTQWDVNGDYTVEEFRDSYLYGGYDIVGIADHNFITPAVGGTTLRSPQGYEHGYNLNNFHVLMLGAQENDLVDNPFMLLPNHQMQYAIERLSSQAALISLNHPERLRGINRDVYSRLRGFSVMEINPDGDTYSWDGILSAGNYVAILGGDDAHSITNRGSWFQRAFTMLGVSRDASEQQILDAIRDGRSYAVTVSTDRNQQGVHKDLPILERIQMRGDTLSVGFSQMPSKIEFIAQGGVVQSTLTGTRNAELVIPNTAQYIRVQASFEDGVRIFTNPIVRSLTAEKPEPLPMPRRIGWLTILNIVGWAVLALFVLIFLMWGIWRKPKKRSYFESTMWGAGQHDYDPS